MTDNLVIEGDAGTITVPGGTLTAVVTRAAEGVAGTRVRRRGASVEVAGSSAHVRLDLVVGYGTVLPEAGPAIQRSVTDALARMCGLTSTAVDLHVEDVE
jgi:uncharacterized alkaline shock family protein YloU